MHGILVEQLPKPWPERLHEGDVRVLHQWLEPVENGNAVWHIRTLDDGLGVTLSSLFEKTRTFKCRHNSQMLYLSDINTETQTVEKMMNDSWEKQSKGVRLRFLSPVSHRIHGESVNMPSAELVLRSINRKFCALAPDFVLAEEEAVSEVISACRITKYDLHSLTFQLEGHYVPAYQGMIEISFVGDENICALADFLLNLSGWTGVGMKTALGMGGCKATRISR